MYRSPFANFFSTTLSSFSSEIEAEVGVTLREVAWDLLLGMIITDLGVVEVVVVVSSSVFSTAFTHRIGSGILSNSMDATN